MAAETNLIGIVDLKRNSNQKYNLNLNVFVKLIV